MSCSIISLLISLFLLFALPSTRADEVTFNGTFTCNIPSRSDDYCMLLRYMEDDFLVDDIVALENIECGGPKDSHVHANFDDGDGAADNFYELYVAVTHTCTEDGNIKLFRHSFPVTPIDTKNKEFVYHADLTDRGFAVDDFFDWHPKSLTRNRPRRRN